MQTNGMLYFLPTTHYLNTHKLETTHYLNAHMLETPQLSEFVSSHSVGTVARAARRSCRARRTKPCGESLCADCCFEFKLILLRNFPTRHSVWDLASGEVKSTLKGHTNNVSSVAISPDGQTIVSGSWDNTLR